MLAFMKLTSLAFSAAVLTQQPPALPVAAAFRTEIQVGIRVVAGPLRHPGTGARQQPCQTADRRRAGGNATAIRANGGCHEI